MWEYISSKSIFWQKQTLLFAVIFVLFRLFSYILLPYPYIISGIIVVLLFLFAMLYFQSPPHAFLLLLIELFLGGAGQYFEFLGVSIRTLFLISFLVLTLMHQIGVHFYHEQKHIPTPLIIGIIALLTYVTIAAGRGILAGNHVHALKDLIPYTYLLIIFPAYAMYRRYPFLRAATARLAIVSIIGTALWSLYNFSLFASGFNVIHDAYYKWFRDVSIGKITDLGDNFYRIVEPSHILIVPMLLIITSLLMKAEKHHWIWWTLHALLTLKLTLNFSRGYLLALLIGLIILIIKHKPLQWLKISSYTVVLYLLIFVSLHTISSGFTNPGFDELGLRTTSIAQPEAELSSATRMMLLPAILQQIEQQPIWGRGLGSEVTFFHDDTKRYETTRQYDWGYFELLAELGIVGTLLYLGLLIGVSGTIVRRIFQLHDYHDFYVGLLAACVALAVMHITAPILTHVFGILSVAFITLIITKPVSVFDQFVIFLYQLFHKKKPVI